LANTDVVDTSPGSFQTTANPSFFTVSAHTYAVVAQHVGSATQIYVDLNGSGGFDPTADLVIHLNNSVTLGTGDFIF
jgi:hypothetical protein